jgi:phenylpropionate dioxygenase-like ring-hydroxylating dioxygenase large terminal subunit
MKKPEPPSPRALAYAAAERLAAVAVRDWAINGSHTWENRNDDVETVHKTLLQREKLDPISALSAEIDTYTTGAERIRMCDMAAAIYTPAAEAGYLYGLALGLALARRVL